MHCLRNAFSQYLSTVIPAKAGIQVEKAEFRIKSGMTT
jgi:hypothetical protein